jgi:hypothetical protein
MWWTLLIVVAAALIFGSIRIWRFRNRDFRAAVVIETLRLWREMVQDYRDSHPEETYTVDVFTEAAYHAVQQSKVNKTILERAWGNVKNMTKFIVQECNQGRNVGPSQTIYANSDIEAARAVVHGCDLRRKGKLGELRVRVRAASARGEEICFYSDPPHSN